MRFRLSVLLLLVAPLSIWAQTNGVTPELLDEKISATRAAFGVPSVSVAIVRNGTTIYAKAFGEADIERARAADTSTRYAVGSISKQFTAAALLIAQQQGKLSLDDKVSKFYPQLTRANEITVRQLLSHTSGYEDYAPQDYMIPEWAKPTTPEKILDTWAKKPLDFDPGTRWQYSNTNYVLAGKILEKATGQELVPFLQEHFFTPLGMNSTGDCDVHNAADATAYTRFALGPPHPVAREGSGWYFAAGELCMTPSDLARWDIAFLQKRIVNAKSYGEWTRAAKLQNGKGTHYALGLTVSESHGTPTISHSGEVSGFLAANTALPAKDAAIVVLTNQDGVTLIGALTQELIGLLTDPPSGATQKRSDQIRSILSGLQHGQVDRSLFTANANAYFTDMALEDYRKSLEPLGAVHVLSLQSEQGRGGMTHLSYRAHFQQATVGLNIYVMPDGKFEQFLVEEVF